MKHSSHNKIYKDVLIGLLTLGMISGTSLFSPIHAAKTNRGITLTVNKHRSAFKRNRKIKHNNKRIKTKHENLRHRQNKSSSFRKANQRLSLINKKHVRKAQNRILNYRFVTQSGRGNANDACEGASLLMALKHYGLARHKNLKQFVDTIPRRRNPERGYTGNPYEFGTGASLYPRALLRVAKRYGAKKSYIIDDYYSRRARGSRLYRHKASSKRFIRAILSGHPIVFEGASKMQYGTRSYTRGRRGLKSDDVLLLYGYKHHRFYWTSPVHVHNRWGSTRVGQFMYIINAPVRGPRAVAIAK